MSFAAAQVLVCSIYFHLSEGIKKFFFLLISSLTHWLLNSMLFDLCEFSSFLPIIDFLLAKVLDVISTF